MIDFAAALTLVDAALRPTWHGGGTFHVSPDGFEDATHYRVNVGNREWLVDADHSFALIGDAAIFVDKTTGEITFTNNVQALTKTAAMTAVSA